MANGIYGTAAAGLGNASWAVNADVAAIGAKGETRTAEILDRFAGRAAILHDLRIPIPGVTANIDHVVVSGNRVLILDTKVWKPGLYWTFGGANRRGWERVVHTEKKTMEMARSALVQFLVRTRAEVVRPKVLVWSSRTTEPVRTIFFKVPGADVLKAEKTASLLESFISRKEADGAVVHRLMELTDRSKRTTRGPLVDHGADQLRTTGWTTADRSNGPLADHPSYSRDGISNASAQDRIRERLRNDKDPFAA